MFMSVLFFVMLAARMSAIGGPKVAAPIFAVCFTLLTLFGSGPILHKLVLIVLTCGLAFGAFILLDRLGDGIVTSLAGGIVLGSIVSFVPDFATARMFGDGSAMRAQANANFPIAYKVPAGYEVQEIGEIVSLQSTDGRDALITMGYEPQLSYDKSLAGDKGFANTPGMTLAYVSANGLEGYELVQDHSSGLAGQRYIRQPRGAIRIRYGWKKGPQAAENQRDVDALMRSLRAK